MPTFAPRDRKVMLVLEDDAGVRRMLRLTLGGAGFALMEVDTGTKALARLEEGGIDAVVLDLGLPDSRASDVLAWLHAHDERPPWLVISVLDRAEASRADSTIAARFIAKPFDPWALLERVKALISGDQEGAKK